MRYTAVMTVVVAMAAAAAALVAAPAAETGGGQQVEVNTRGMTGEEIQRLPSASGAELYALLCASCHGVDGTGDAAARKLYGDRLTDLTTLKAKDPAGEYPRLHVAYVLRHPVAEKHVTEKEIAAMPNWSEVLSGTGCERALEMSVVKRLIDHVETLQK